MQVKEPLTLERKLTVCLGVAGFVIGLVAEPAAGTQLSAFTAQILKIFSAAFGFTSYLAVVIPQNKGSHVIVLFALTVIFYLLLILS